MGYITTLSIYNDGLDNIKQNPTEFANKIYDCISGLPYKTQTIGLGNFANLISIQPARHSNNNTIYIHAGNCVTEFSYRNVSNDPDFFKKNSFHKKLLKIAIENTNDILETLPDEEIYQLLIEDTPIIPKQKLPEELHNKILSKSLTDEINNSIKQYLKFYG